MAEPNETSALPLRDLTFPTDWELLPDPPEATVLVAREPVDPDAPERFRANLVLTEVTTGGLGFRDWQVGTDELLPRVLDDYLLVDLERLDLGGTPGGRRLAHYAGPHGEALTMEQWFALVDGIGHTLTATIETWRYDELADLCAATAGELAAMIIDIDPTSGAIRLDQDGVDAVLAGTVGVSESAAAAIADPMATMVLTVTGEHGSLEHRVWLRPGSSALLLGVRSGLFQLMEQDPAFLTAALVRLTRMTPPGSPGRGASFSWELAVRWASGERHLSASDGPDGLQVVDPETGTPTPRSNTEVYRMFSSLLPTDQELAAG